MVAQDCKTRIIINVDTVNEIFFMIFDLCLFLVVDHADPANNLQMPSGWRVIISSDTPGSKVQVFDFFDGCLSSLFL
jgi:hypothetical protein